MSEDAVQADAPAAEAPKYLQKKGAKQFANPLEFETNDAAQPSNFFNQKEKEFGDGPSEPTSSDIDLDHLKVLAMDCRREAEEEELSSGPARARIFACICFLEVMVNFDAGVLPVTVSHVMTEFRLSFSMAGMLGALVYLGLVLCSPVAGYLLTNLPSQQNLLVVACCANSLAVLSFALAPSTIWLCVGRALIGFTQAPIIIYMPVWVDEFAPPVDATMWMSLLQASVAIGIMCGYVVAGLVVTYVGEETCTDHGCYSPNWRVGIYIQSIGMMLFAPFFYFVAGRHVNSRGDPEGRVMHASEERLAQKLMLQSLQGPGLRANHTTQRQIRRTVAQQVQQQVALHNLDGETSMDSSPVAPPWGDEWTNRATATDKGASSWKARLAKDQESVDHLHEMPEHHQSVIEQGTHALFDHIKTTVGMVGLFENKHEAGRAARDLENKVEMSLGTQLKFMFSNKIFVLLTLALSGLYFVVTGLQFWVTDYMTTPVAEGGIGIDPGLVVISFALSSLTGPTAGVFFGGWYIDKHGGYKDDTGEAAAGTLKRCTCFGALALAFAFPAAFLTSFWPIQVAMWFVLFWGGALLSPATGVCINAVSPELRAFSSALSMFSYNILGYAAAPFLCGILAEKFSLKWGFRVVLLSSGVAFIGLLFAWRAAEEEYKQRRCDRAHCAVPRSACPALCRAPVLSYGTYTAVGMERPSAVACVCLRADMRAFTCRPCVPLLEHWAHSGRRQSHGNVRRPRYQG